MPATAFFLSCFYKKGELFFRMSLFIASSSLANSFGGLLAAALRYVSLSLNSATACAMTLTDRWILQRDSSLGYFLGDDL